MDQAAKLRAFVGAPSPQPSPARGEGVSSLIAHRSLLAVTSGKGGVGKTTISVNLALLLAERGQRVLLVDADLGLANADVMLGIEPGRHIGHLLLPDYSPEDVALSGPGGIKVISGGSGLRELVEATEADRRVLLDKLEEYYREFDWVVMDTSPGIGGGVIDFLARADEVLLVTTPEPTALRDTYAALKTFDRRIPDASIRLIVNSSPSESSAREAVRVVNEVAEKFLNRKYERWSTIDADDLVSRSIHRRKPLVEASPRSKAALSLRRLASQLLEETHDMARTA